MKTEVLIIGGGATGTGIARDLALRGVNTKKTVEAKASFTCHRTVLRQGTQGGDERHQ